MCLFAARRKPLNGVQALCRWLEEPDPSRGIRFREPDGGWSYHPYPQLAGKAFAVAKLLRGSGAVPGDAVGLAFGSSPEFVSGFFGTLAAGCVPTPIAPPMPLRQLAEYQRRLTAQMAATRPHTLLVREDLVDLIRRIVGQTCRRVTPLAASCLTDTAGPARIAAPARSALLQFTSGSAGSPRAVSVSAESLLTNIKAIRAWLRMGRDDATATWLPPYHDMGLVGCLLTPVTSGNDLWIMQPGDFVRTPLEWLRCFGERGARLTAVPSSGLVQVLRRVRPEALAGLDFAEWKALITGAERIAPEVLDSFTALLRPFGFRRRTLLPAYGLAEATLVVTGLSLDAEPTVLQVERGSLQPGHPIRLARSGTASEEQVTVVGCGSTIVPGSQLRVIDPVGRPLGADHCGEILISGPGMADGYQGGARSYAFAGHTVRTGDCGFLHDGQIYVLGRLGDGLRLRGRTVFAEDIEADLARLPGLARKWKAVLLGTRGGTDTAVLVAEAAPGPWAAQAAKLLRLRVEGAEVLVVAGPPGTVWRTSSGKPRRRPMWTEFLRGTLGGQVLIGAGATGTSDGVRRSVDDPP